MPIPQWLAWSRRLQAIAQTGLTYCTDDFDRERYVHIREIAGEIAVAAVDLPDATVVREMYQAGAGYTTPKVDVRAVVFDADGRILLVREREDGGWTLPGGWADVGDSPSVNVVREVKEESGYEVRATKLLAVYDRDLHDHPPIPFHAYKVYFLCELTGGAAANSNETDGVGFFAEGAIPPLSLTRVTGAQIEHMFEHRRHPEWPASFD